MAKRRKRSKKAPIIIISVAVLGMIGLAFSMFGSMNNKEKIVTVAQVERSTITQKVTAIGRIQPEIEVDISSETPGEIIFLAVREGDPVNTNELLVKIKPDIFETRLEQSKASIEASKMDIEVRKAEKNRTAADLKRKTELYEKEFVSKATFDQATASYESAVSSYKASLSRLDQTTASYKEVKKNAERSTIFSPINGTVTSLTVEKGEKVVGTAQMAGTTMMKISDLSVMNAVVDVDENDIVRVNIGDTANIEIDAFPERLFKGSVIEIGHAARTSSLGSQDQVTNFQVKVRLLDTALRLRPGMSCNASIVTETKYNVLSVPLQSVTVRVEKNKEQKDGMIDKTKGIKGKTKRPPSVIFVVKGNIVKMQEVGVGISDKGIIEITKGLSESDSIVSGSYRAISKELEDGTHIKIKKDNIKKKK